MQEARCYSIRPQIRANIFFFLGALFIIATGCAFLETAANPYITILGEPTTAATRLNFAQSFNGFGAFIAPMLGGNLILSGVEHSNADLAALTPEQLNQYLQTEADAVKIPYLGIAAVVLIVALLIYLTKMPEVERSGNQIKTSVSKAWSHKHLKWGVIAQFFYVGAQVCVTSLFIPFAKYTNNMPEKTAAWWLGIALLGFMIGRFVGTFLSRFIAPNKLLTAYSLSCVLLLTLAVFVKSGIAMWAVFTVPFFESIMFPTIFALAIKDLKEDTEIGSSLVVMAVAGGGLFPLAMGLLSDQFNLQVGYLVPLLCFIVVVWYGISGYKIEKHETILPNT